VLNKYNLFQLFYLQLFDIAVFILLACILYYIHSMEQLCLVSTEKELPLAMKSDTDYKEQLYLNVSNALHRWAGKK